MFTKANRERENTIELITRANNSTKSKLHHAS